MRKKKTITTISDVAKKAGVSKTTVSFVLNNEKGVGEATKKKVFKVIKDLNYIPNSSAKSLRAGSTKKIAVVSYRFSSQFLSKLIEGFEDKFYALNNDEYTIDFYSSENSEKKKNEILKEILYGHKADGVVLISQAPTKSIEKEYLKMNIPLLLIENVSDISSSITVDNCVGATLAVENLISRGKSKIGIINPEFALEEANSVSYLRRKAYRDVLTKHNIAIEEKHDWSVLRLVNEEGYDLADEIIDSGIDALFVAAGDLVTIGFLERCNERGIKIPEDIAIVSYDNMLYSALLTPPLTTVHQPIDEMGELAFEMIFEKMNNKQFVNKSVVLDPKLILRKT